MSKSVCILGDSITAGVVFSPERERYVHLKDSFVNLVKERLNIEVRNNSKFGCTVRAMLNKMERWADSIAESEHTVIMLGGNDSDFDWPAVAEAPEQSHDCNTPMADFIEGFNKVIDRVLQLGSKPLIMTMTPVYGKAYYNWICRKCDPEAIMQFLHSPESIEHWNEMYNTAVMKIAGLRNLPVLDVRSPFLCKKFYGDFFSKDGIHPSEDGHRLIFDYLLPQVSSVLS